MTGESWMQEGAGRIAGGLVLLVALWIGVYWWWPSEPKISYAQGDESVRGIAPREAPAPKPALPKPVVKPASNVQATPNPGTERPKPAPRPTPPPTPPAPTQAVIPPEFTQHTVQKGETFESIARKYYGDNGHAAIIARANPFVDPTRLAPGRIIKVPKDPNNIQGIAVAPVPEKAPEPAPKPAPPALDGPFTEYVVVSGDTLSKIASEVYGESRLAGMIYEANRDQMSSEHSLRIGQILRIPAKPK
jgi:nucleoid-associated protein YgaU